MAGGWNPWRALRARVHVKLEHVDLPDGIDGECETTETTAVIRLDRRLDRTERNAVLAHELVHEERGGGIDFEGAAPTWAAVVAREERLVDVEVARRLVPADELAAFLRTRDDLGEHVTVVDVAHEFDVPEWVAAIALATAA